MSREERKMAQIIASIERMEQEARASGDDSCRTQEPHDWTRQGGKGKKGKKGKLLGVKAKAGKKSKVSAGGEGIKATFERKLTPKQRWIQLWSAQLDDTKEKDCGSLKEGVGDKNTEENVEIETTKEPVDTTSFVADKVDSSGPHQSATFVAAKGEKEGSVIDEPIDVSTVPLAFVAPNEKAVPVLIPASAKEQFTEVSKTTMTTPREDDVIAMESSSSLELRVKTPLNNESSHLSPPLERNSPTTTASISPSAKVKDTDTPNTNPTAAAKFSPAATEKENSIAGDTQDLSGKEPGAFRLERACSNSNSGSRGDDAYSRETSDCQSDRGRKRNWEDMESPMSEEAKRRAERRRKRKSNWDVGDPRKGGSPVADPMISAAAAAANQQSFAKYPPTRPSWRHSQSMMEIKPQFQSSYRSSSFYNNGPTAGGRRAFYHSSSLPQDRSRSAGRSSTRHSYGNSSSGSNYR
ncbi:hypothetical protein DD237_002080 [Peronospora effusa]|uniref:Uncharacterized protein n=1 Tax=Peronospora effusa TaxID=542832 RepID=A0A425BYR1_9STRA|nr:hypothetical protein DD237_002080 [Peronospora effusa]